MFWTSHTTLFSNIECIVPGLTAAKSYLLQVIILELDNIKANDTNYDTKPVQKVLQAMEQAGAEAFILGCTEVPVAVTMYHLTGKFIDATEVLAEKAVAEAGGKVISHLPQRA